jgi:hypothetical protein
VKMSDALPEPYFLKSDFGIGGEKGAKEET